MSDAQHEPKPDADTPDPAAVTGSAPQQAERPEASVTPDDVVDVSAVVTPPRD